MARLFFKLEHVDDGVQNILSLVDNCDEGLEVETLLGVTKATAGKFLANGAICEYS